MEENTYDSEHYEYNKKLKNRINLLRETIRTLRDELLLEREEWKRQLYYKRSRQPYALRNFHITNVELMKKQLAMANYKRRLMDVENMCNAEMLRVKKSVQILEPLQKMASGWKMSESTSEVNEVESQNTEVSMPLELIAKSATSDEVMSCPETSSEPAITENSVKSEQKQSQSQPNLTDN